MSVHMNIKTGTKGGKLPAMLSSSPGASTGKPKAPKKVSTGNKGSDVLPPDEISNLAHEIENLPNEKAALTVAHELLLDHGLNYFRLGGVLSVIHDKQWFGSCESFGQLCEAEFGFKKSKGYHLIQIYETLLLTGVTWEEVKKLGWAKVSIVCTMKAAASVGIDDVSAHIPPAKGVEQFSKLLEKAKQLSVAELRNEIEAAVGDGEATTTGNKKHTLQFTVFSDQLDAINGALDKCKDISGQSNDGHALERICMDFLAGQGVAVKAKELTLKVLCERVLQEHEGDEDAAVTEIFEEVKAVFEGWTFQAESPDHAES